VEAAQHKGLGKALLQEAERIAGNQFQMRQIAVLSGVGAKEYYRAEFGYRPQGEYMARSLETPAGHTLTAIVPPN
jgi:elongator complex protein 3